MQYYKFTDTDAEPDSKLIDILNNKDKKELKKMYKKFSFGVDGLLKNGCYKLMGWEYNFRNLCKTYIVRFNYDNVYFKYYAPDKTSLYEALGGRHKIFEIYEISQGALM